jgi:hypothetical protein
MAPANHQAKIEYGDFQTPLGLATKVCQKLVELGVKPRVVIEPTCGFGNFVNAAAQVFHTAEKIIGVEINSAYLQKNNPIEGLFNDERVEIHQGNFFDFDWVSLIKDCQIKDRQGEILILGNFPWVTNSQQGQISGTNLPQKHNFQKHSGLDAITGKSNFDISEWMLIKAVDWIHAHNGCIAMLCKTSVTRKLLNYIRAQKLNLAYFSIYKIDAKQHFGAIVDACLLVCKFDSTSQNYFCDVFEDLENSNHSRIGYYKTTLIRDLESFQQVSRLFTSKTQIKWRSGIKHDCSNVMEFRKVKGNLINGFGKTVEIEDTYLYSLFKGSDVANGNIHATDKYMLVTQKNAGDSTELIREIAPKTWSYLAENSKYLNSRKSRIYQNNPQFSIFGVGTYTFAPWKIAISGLYKRLNFRLVHPLTEKPAIFDDTVYFLSFEDEQSARKTFALLTSKLATAFYLSLIFWDEKRPIKTSILNSLDLEALGKVQSQLEKLLV